MAVMDDKRPAMKAIYNGVTVPDGMAVGSAEFADYLWERAKLGDERAIQALLGPHGNHLHPGSTIS